MALMVMMEVMLRESLGLGTLQESDQSEITLWISRQCTSSSQPLWGLQCGL